MIFFLCFSITKNMMTICQYCYYILSSTTLCRDRRILIHVKRSLITISMTNNQKQSQGLQKYDDNNEMMILFVFVIVISYQGKLNYLHHSVVSRDYSCLKDDHIIKYEETFLKCTRFSTLDFTI